MLMVAICDDEVPIGAELESTLIDIFGKLNVKHKIDVYCTGEELNRELTAGEHYDLIFLDIEFAKGELNGVEVGRLIRDAHKNYTSSIIFISWVSMYAMQLFGIRPFNFLVKPLEPDIIEKNIRDYLELAGFLSGELVYKVGHETCKAQLKDIAYLENSRKQVIINFKDGRTEFFYGSLKDVYHEQLAGFDFLYI